jgi:hypothetical protein
LNMAISDSDGSVYFSVLTGQGYLSTCGKVSPTSSDRSALINATTLDLLYTNPGVKPNLIKIDVEGHELQVLQGSSAVLDALSLDLIFESVFNENTEVLEAFLVERGYQFYILRDDLLCLEAVKYLRPTLSGTLDMGSLNRFATKRSFAEILKLNQGRRVFWP